MKTQHDVECNGCGGVECKKSGCYTKMSVGSPAFCPEHNELNKVTGYKLQPIGNKDLKKINRLYSMLNRQNTVMENLRKDKNLAYEERNKLVCALSKIYPSWLGKHEDDPTWQKEWFNIVFVQLPTGQASWHIHEDLLPLFAHLELDLSKKWDKHSTEEKYDRLSKIKF